MNRPPPIDAKAVFNAVKEVKKTINRRGARPGNLVLILDPVNDDVVIGTTDDMTLDDTVALLRVGLRGGVEDSSDALRHEIICQLTAAKLPDHFAVLSLDKHTGKHLFITREVNLAPVVGEAMFQVGRLLGRMDAKAAVQRLAAGQTNPNPAIKLEAKPAVSKWQRVRNWVLLR
jgi:hypothetical protein